MKKRFHRGMAAAALGLLVAGSAQAATLFTPPADAGYADELFGCRATNVGQKPVHVLIEMRNYAGATVQSGEYTLSPEQTSAGPDWSSGSYCKFTVDGSSKAVRATASYFTSEGIVTTTIRAK